MKLNTKIRLLEFVVAGLILDLTENIISIKLTTGERITAKTLFIAFLVVIPLPYLPSSS